MRVVSEAVDNSSGWVFKPKPRPALGAQMPSQELPLSPTVEVLIRVRNGVSQLMTLEITEKLFES